MSKEEMIDEIINICNANKNNIYCDKEFLVHMIFKVIKDER